LTDKDEIHLFFLLQLFEPPRKNFPFLHLYLWQKQQSQIKNIRFSGFDVAGIIKAGFRNVSNSSRNDTKNIKIDIASKANFCCHKYILCHT